MRESKNLRAQFGQLRDKTHSSMREEEERRHKENPKPTELEIRIGVFKEDLEPQVRDAIFKMFEKGYASQSSGFDGARYEMQQIDGNFNIDDETKKKLNDIGAEVIGGVELGVPMNKSITAIRFRATEPTIESIKRTWDAIADILPVIELPDGVIAIDDKAEGFREEHAPDHPSVDEMRSKYRKYIRKVKGLPEE